MNTGLQNGHRLAESALHLHLYTGLSTIAEKEQRIPAQSKSGTARLDAAAAGQCIDQNCDEQHEACDDEFDAGAQP